MSRWAEAFGAHAIHGAIEELQQHVSTEPEEVDEELADEIRRISKLLELLRQTLSSVDPELVPANLLTNINNQLRHQNILGQLASYASNGAIGHLQNANNNFDGSVLPAVQQLLAYKTEQNALSTDKQLNAILSAFAEKSKAEREELREDYEAQSTRITDTNTQLEELRASLNELDTELAGKLESWTSDFAGDQTRREEAFSQSEASRTSTFSDWFKPTSKAAQEDLQQFFNGIHTELDALKADSEAKHKDILDLHELVAGDSVAVGYLNDGKSEKKQADRWRLISTGFIFLTVAWLLGAFALSYFTDEAEQQVWINLIRTGSLTGVLLFGAAYASRQSKSHRDQERRARWYGLEMKALDPYITSLDPETQKALKEKLAERFFGQQPNDAPTGKPAVDSDLLNKLTDLLAKLVDR